jgi:LmbE family N-acetylglucosaminyl deacetylase
MTLVTPRSMSQSTGSTAPPRVLLAVHGHPDDETVTMGGVLARYASEGVRVVCVVGTAGDLGDIVDPALDTSENRRRVGELRLMELERALRRLGSIEYRLLGYRDSGMPGAPANQDPRSFWAADPHEALGRLVKIVRGVRADVIVAPNLHGGDGHPDHVQAARLAAAAFEAAGDPSQFPDQLAEPGMVPWSPSKLYETVAQTSRAEKLRRAFHEGGVGGLASTVVRVARHWSPGAERRRDAMAAGQGRVTTRVDVGPYLEAKYAALREYRTQIHRNDSYFAISPERRRQLNSSEDFTLRASRVTSVVPEHDLFAGIR